MPELFILLSEPELFSFFHMIIFKEIINLGGKELAKRSLYSTVIDFLFIF